MCAWTRQISGFLVLLVLAACDAPTPLIYEPTKWQRVQGEDFAWQSNWGKVEIRSYRQIREDDRWPSYRVEFEIYNNSSAAITFVESATLETRDRTHVGTLVRLFSPEGLKVKAGDYAQTAAVFEFPQPAREMMGETVRVTFYAAQSGKGRQRFVLELARAKPVL